MNRVYKVIWSKAKHCYVVTSEIARSVTKSASSACSAGRKGAAVLAMAALLFTAGGVLGEAATANVTDVSGSSDARNLIIVTKDDGTSTNFSINNVAHATTADRATSDANGAVIDRYYVNNDAAKVKAGGTYVNEDNTVGQNLSALDTQVKKNTEAVVKVGKEAGENFTDLYAKVQTNADAVAAEETARKTADQNNLKVGDYGVISKVSNDGTTPSAVKTLVLNKEGKNQITLSEDGIKVGLNSGVMDKDGFYAGGDDYEHAGAALKWDGSIKGADGKFTVDKDGSIKGADGKFTVDKDGNAAIGGTLTVDKNLTVNGTFDSKTLSSKLGENNYTTINGGKTESMNLKVDAVGTETKASSSTFDENGSSAWAKDDESIGKSSMTADKISQSLSDKGDNPKNAASRVLSQNKDNKYEIADSVVDVNGNTNTSTQLSDRTITNIKNGTNESIDLQEVNQIGSSVTDGTNTTVVSQNAGSLIFSITDKAKNTSTGVTQTATDITNTAKNGTIANEAKDITNHATENMTNTVGGNLTTTVTGDSSLKAENITNEAKNKITNKAIDVETDATSSIVQKVTNDAGSNTSTQWSYQTKEEMSQTDGKTASYLRGAAEEKSQLTDGDKKTTIDTIAGQTNTSITDGKNISNSLQKADQAASSVTDGKNTTVVDQKAGSIASSITDGTKANNTNNTVDKSEQLIKADDTHYYAETKTAGSAVEALKSDGNTIIIGKDAAAATVSSAVTDGTNTTGSTMTAKGITNSAAESIVNEIGNGSKVKSEMTAKGITNTAKDGTITNDAKDLVNNASENMTNTVGKDLTTTVGGNETHAVTGSQTVTVSKGRTVNVKGTETENFNAQVTNIKTDQRTSVGGNQTNIVAGNQQNTVSGSKTETVKGSVTEKYGSQATTVDGDQRTNVGGNQFNVVAGNQTNTISGSKTETVKGAVTETYGSQTTKVNGDQSTTVTGKQTNSITGDQVNTIGGNQTTTVTGDSSLSAKNITNTAKGGTIYNKSKDILNEASGDILNFADGEIGNVATKITNITGKNTVISDNDGTTFENEDAKTPFVKGGEVNTKITGNKVETGKVLTDDLTVRGTSEFVGRADFRNDVYVDENLTVAKETRTDTLYVDHDGYVGGNLNVDGNIETHDAVLSADSRQVVTGRQLYQTNERVDRLDNRIKKVGANAAALAALRPGDFNPDDKFSIAAGFGSYRNASAAALGLFYRPNENVILSLGTSFGDGENMVNAGVSVKFGRGKSMAERRKEMAEEVSVMRDEMKNQNDRIAELEEMLKKQSELIEKLSKES